MRQAADESWMTLAHMSRSGMAHSVQLQTTTQISSSVSPVPDFLFWGVTGEMVTCMRSINPPTADQAEPGRLSMLGTSGLACCLVSIIMICNAINNLASCHHVQAAVLLACIG